VAGVHLVFVDEGSTSSVVGKHVLVRPWFFIDGLGFAWCLRVDRGSCPIRHIRTRSLAALLDAPDRSIFRGKALVSLGSLRPHPATCRTLRRTIPSAVLGVLSFHPRAWPPWLRPRSCPLHTPWVRVRCPSLAHTHGSIARVNSKGLRNRNPRKRERERARLTPEGGDRKDRGRGTGVACGESMRGTGWVQVQEHVFRPKRTRRDGFLVHAIHPRGPTNRSSIRTDPLVGNKPEPNRPPAPKRSETTTSGRRLDNRGTPST